MYERISPKQSQCHGRGCYCFYGKSPLDIEDDITEASSISSWHNDDDDHLDEFTDLPPLVQSVIAPFLDPEDDDAAAAPAAAAAAPPPLFNQHLYFDEAGNEVSFDEYTKLEALQEIRAASDEAGNEGYDDEYDDDCEDWAFSLRTKINKVVFYHPRVLLAYFRFVSFHNELVDDEDKIKIPLMPKEIAAKALSHSSIQDPPEEFADEVFDLVSYINRYTKPE